MNHIPTDPSSAGGDAEELTIARKRSRRVSFAETTAVHVFDRDEDFETPPDSKPAEEGSEPENAELGFHADQFDSDDSKGTAREEEEDDDDVEQAKFIVDMDSSSPGSVAASVTSNDDDNFFGPVSTSFIKTGRLSEAGMSDDNNHDITLDSTAFSLHFMNLVPPDSSANSAGSLRTPTGDSVPTDSHGFVMCKGFQKQATQSNISNEKTIGSAGGLSNMSLVVENPDSYDRYGKMSPTLEALLAEANKTMQPNSPVIGSGTRTSQHANQVKTVKESAKDEIGGRSKSTAGMADDAGIDSNLAEGRRVGIDSDHNGNVIHSPNKAADPSVDALKEKCKVSPKINGCSKDVCEEIPSNLVCQGIQNPDMLSPLHGKSHNSFTFQSNQVHQELFQDQGSGIKHPLGTELQSTPIVPVLMNVNVQQELLFDNGWQSPQNPVPTYPSPLTGSVSSLRSKRQHLFLDPSAMSPNKLMNTPDNEVPLSSLKLKLVQHGERISAIKIPMSVIHNSTAKSEMWSKKVSKLQSPAELKNDTPFDKLLDQIEGYNNFHIGNQDQDTVEETLMNLEERLYVEGRVSSNDHALEDVDKLHAIVNMSDEFLDERNIQNPNNERQVDMPHPTNLNIMLPSESAQDLILPDNNLTHQDLQSAHESQSAQTDVSEKKRGIAHIFPADEEHLIEVSRIHKSPKVFPDCDGNKCGIFSVRDIECINEALGNENQSPQEHWKDILAKVFEVTKQPLSPLMSKLNLVELDVLEYVLGELQSARKYERIFTSLRNHECLDECNKKRVAEARSLLDKLVFAKAKLHLKRMKLDKLSDKAQLCKSKIQECGKLKLFYSQFRIHNARQVQSEKRQHPSDSNNSITVYQGQCNGDASMRQELEMLDQNLNQMMRIFETSCRIKRNMSYDGVIRAVNDHIEMKNRCRLIQQDLQMWRLSDVVTRNNQCDIVLNYCDILFQRFTIHHGSVSSIVAYTFLDFAIIEKKFPNMNACIAFEFIFGANGVRILDKSEQLSKETLETNILFGALIDVLEEVRISRLHSWNLISSTFHLQGSGLLGMHLTFIDFRSGRKITLSLDLTILNCAGYPSNPSDLQLRVVEANYALAPSISDKIMGVVGGLDSGRNVIIRLCQGVSKIVMDGF